MTNIKTVSNTEIIADSVSRTVMEQGFFATASDGSARFLNSTGTHIGNGIV